MSNYPIYIISKGRWDIPLTANSLERNNIPYRIVVEPTELNEYSRVIDSNKILVLPFSNLGEGSIPARNWVWEHSITEGHKKHWILDDNIFKFMRLNRNKRIPCYSSKIFNICEDFVDRYSNVGLAGMNYQNFAHDRVEMPPYRTNTRIYSCILIDNSLPFRWRGKYNEDTDLSLRVLKSGLCTILFNALLIDKTGASRNKGGNTDNLYNKTNKRKEFAESLKEQHPELVDIVWRFNRWHHQVNYKPFLKNALIKKEGLKIQSGINNYGMVFRAVQ